MNIAICYTKVDNWAVNLTNAFAEGIIACGDEIIRLRHCFQIDLLNHCDAAFNCGEINRNIDNDHMNLRMFVKEHMDKRSKRRIIGETGYFKHYRVVPISEAYYSIGFDTIKRKADYNNTNSPPDRWKMLGLEMEPWRTSGEHVLIFGQPTLSGHLYGFPLRDWLTNTARQIRENTDRPIILRRHPFQNFKVNAGIDNFQHSPRDNTIEDDLKNAWCAVALTTNAAVDAILQGIPVITLDDRNVAYDVSEHRIENIESPATPDRTQWACNLAYTQWNIEEVRAGLTWKHLRSRVYHECLTESQ